ncbi:hypothetical protein ACIBBB_27050 [Streptomyces sp. NPDC051217]|uniref:hypothetical protein n=1 Tax=Streptomyces sp. NPDC051217 TaxID=3365644 RepID=UPI0037AD7E93
MATILRQVDPQQQSFAVTSRTWYEAVAARLLLSGGLVDEEAGGKLLIEVRALAARLVDR